MKGRRNWGQRRRIIKDRRIFEYDTVFPDRRINKTNRRSGVDRRKLKYYKRSWV